MPRVISRDETELYPLEKVRETLEALPHFQELGIRIVEVVRGACTARLEPSPRLVGNPDTGAVHGGVITTLLDSVGGAAAFSAVRLGQTVATLDLRIDYLRAAEPGLDLYGHAQCIKRTRSVAFVRGTAYDRDPEDPFATCIATFMLGANPSEHPLQRLAEEAR